MSTSLQENTNQLALKGKRALFDVLRVHSWLEQMIHNASFKIFDTEIQLILIYASELWGVLTNY